MCFVFSYLQYKPQFPLVPCFILVFYLLWSGTCGFSLTEALLKNAHSSFGPGVILSVSVLTLNSNTDCKSVLQAPSSSRHSLRASIAFPKVLAEWQSLTAGAIQRQSSSSAWLRASRSARHDTLQNGIFFQENKYSIILNLDLMYSIQT